MRTLLYITLLITTLAPCIKADAFSFAAKEKQVNDTLINNNDSTTIKNDTIKVIQVLIEKEKPKHMTYKRIPIDGTLQTFGQELIKTGFKTKTYGQNNIPTSFIGPFSGFTVITIPSVTPLSHSVYKVETQFCSKKTWNSIYDEYCLFKEHLIQVYGHPVKITETFLSPYVKDDGYSMKALSENKVDYLCIWDTGNGLILLTIKATIRDEGYVSLTYQDNINFQLLDKEKTQIIQQDL